MPIIVAEDDPIIRAVQVLLDPDAPADRVAAISDYYSVDVDFEAWMDATRARAPGAYPASMPLVDDQESLRAALGDAEGLIVEGLAVGPEELDAAPKLKIVQKFGADLRNIDQEACAARGVVVKPLRRRVNVAVAEQAFAMMLALAKRLCTLNRMIDEESLKAAGYSPKLFDPNHCGKSNWARITGLGTLQGATYGAVGLGEIGREVAARARAFEMDVLYYQRNRLPEDIEGPLGATHCGLEEMLERADFITIHLPHNAQTEGMIGREQFARMKPGAILVNIARAPIVDRDALIEALESGKLGGVGMDVHYKEPGDPGDPLLKFDNVVLTPHTGVASRWNGAWDMEELANNIHAVLG